jgi:hypothetical protein
MIKFKKIYNQYDNDPYTDIGDACLSMVFHCVILFDYISENIGEIKKASNNKKTYGDIINEVVILTMKEGYAFYKEAEDGN